MEQNNGSGLRVGGLLVTIGALGYAAYTIAKKVKEIKAQQVIEIKPEPAPEAEKIEE